jgi:UDP-N-acetylglucosamine:LPS N-acetylglucosamine transferase
VQLIILCGRHEQASAKLLSIRHGVPVFVQGFTSDVPYYMSLADLFIGKPGPGTISEALAMKLPVIVERNHWTLAHERYNAAWIMEQHAGPVVDNFSQVAEAVAELLSPERYQLCRASAAAVQNRSVYEIPSLLETILSDRSPRPSTAPAGVVARQ